MLSWKRVSRWSPSLAIFVTSMAPCFLLHNSQGATRHRAGAGLGWRGWESGCRPGPGPAPLPFQVLRTNQFSVTRHEKVANGLLGDQGLPGVFVLYELSPMMVKLTEKHR